MCLCMILAPLLNPELKNMNALALAKTMEVALKSSMFNGSIYFSNSLVMIMVTKIVLEHFGAPDFDFIDSLQVLSAHGRYFRHLSEQSL